MGEMDGRTCVVTGATTGIGRVAARELARMGADVIVLGRDASKSRDTVQEIRASGGRAEAVLCDLASLASIREAAERIRAMRERVHVLLNNAGGIHMVRRTSVDGYELTVAVNHLGYFFLTELLRDRLIAAGTAARRARVVSVASAIHVRGKLDWDDMWTERNPYRPFDVYAASKLMNVMWTYALARRLEGSHVTANCLHPGVIASGFGQNNSGWLKLGLHVVRPLLWTPEKGARTSITLASSQALEGVTGKYFDQHARETRSARRSYDVAEQERLWRWSEEMISAKAS